MYVSRTFAERIDGRETLKRKSWLETSNDKIKKFNTVKKGETSGNASAKRKKDEI